MKEKAAYLSRFLITTNPNSPAQIGGYICRGDGRSAGAYGGFGRGGSVRFEQNTGARAGGRGRGGRGRG